MDIAKEEFGIESGLVDKNGYSISNPSLDEADIC